MSHPTPMLILFDAAGTLIELVEPVEDVYARHFQKCGWSSDPASLKKAFPEAFRAVPEPVFTPGADGEQVEREWWRQVVLRAAVSSGLAPAAEPFEGCFDRLFDHYASGSAWRPFPEVEEVLGDLKSNGARLAVVSNFDRRLHRVLRELGLSDYFDLVLTSADAGARKPSPRMLQKAVEQLSASGQRICMVGDSVREDGGAAAAAGVPVYLVNRPQTSLRDLPRRLAEIFPAKSAC